MSKRLYTPDLAAAIKAGGNKKYWPSNGFEGEVFQGLWCECCKRDELFRRGEGPGCEILAKTFCYDTSDSEYPAEWTYDSEGQPTCTAFEQRGDDETLRNTRRSTGKARKLYCSGQ